MSICVLHPNFGCLIWHCALFCQNASGIYASGPGPWEVSPASSSTLQIVTLSVIVFIVVCVAAFDLLTFKLHTVSEFSDLECLFINWV